MYKTQHDVSSGPLPSIRSMTHCNHCGNNFSGKSILARHTLLVLGAGQPIQTLAKKYLAQLMDLKVPRAVLQGDFMVMLYWSSVGD